MLGLNPVITKAVAMNSINADAKFVFQESA